MKSIALMDCNNFFVSCERIFNPKLIAKPVVVLSSNDACIIARSNEAKALGIPMGAPLFEYERLLKKNNVYILSANFTLYADISARVMQTVSNLVTEIEIYSIDEAFFYLPIFDNKIKNTNENFYSEYAKYIRGKVQKNIGIPISIGIGTSKTLAKIANKIAKKRNDGVFDITNHNDIDNILKETNVKEIWGIGRSYAKKLNKNGIYNALQLIYTDSRWIKKNLSICGLKTILELKGTACISQINYEIKSSICVSRSFGRNVSSLNELKESLSNHMTIAAEKLRKQGSLTSNISIFICYRNYQDSQIFYKFSNIDLSIASDFTPTLIEYSHNCLEKIYKPNLIYKKAGVILSSFISKDNMQLSTLMSLSKNFDKQNKMIKTIDKINNKLGTNKVFFASSGILRKWDAKQSRKSQKYTTSWNELLTIKI